MQALIEGLAPVTHILIDSGAYTTYGNRLKRAIGQSVAYPDAELEQYIEFCRTVARHVWHYIMLDVIYDPGQSAINLQKMLDAGLRPMPVLVLGMSPDEVHSLLEVSPYLCIAGGATDSRKFVRRRYEETYETVNGKVLIHALAYGRYPDIFQVPIFSADSSTISTGAQYGYLSDYKVHLGFRQLRLEWIQKGANKRPYIKELLLNFVNNWGVTVQEILDPKYHQGMTSIPTLSRVYAYLKFMADTEDRGKRYFAALSNRSWITVIGAVVEFMHENGVDYHAARARAEELRIMSNDDTQYHKYIDHLVKVFSKRTDQEVETMADKIEKEIVNEAANYSHNTS